MSYTRRPMSVLFILLLSFSLLSACTTVQFGSDFDPKAFAEWVKRGETTQKEVRQRLGNPTTMGAVVESDGTHYERWLYYYGNGKIHKLHDANFKMLEVRFDSNRLVSSYNWAAP